MHFKLFVSIIFSFLTGILVLQNTQIIEVNFLFLNLSLSMSALLLAVLVSGVFITIGFSIFKELKYKKIIKAKNKNISRLKKEISALNGSMYGMDVHRDSTSAAYDNISSLLSIKASVGEDLLSSLENKFELEIDNSVNQKKESKIEKESSNKIKNDISQDTMRISTILSGFDDLDDDDFSLKKSSNSNDAPDWFLEKPKSKSRDIIDELLSKKEKHAVIDLKSEYMNEFSSNYDKFEEKKSDFSPSLKSGDKKPHKIKNKNLNKEALYNKLDGQYFQDMSTDEDLVHLYKQNTDPNKTLSKNLVKERFNWKSSMYINNDILEEDDDECEDMSKNTIRNKLNHLFSPNHG